MSDVSEPLPTVLVLPWQHPDRKEERCFVPYKPPPEDSSPAQVEEYLEHGKFITEDLDWLLALRHDKFWCQVSHCGCHTPYDVETGGFDLTKKNLNPLWPSLTRISPPPRWCLMSHCRSVWIPTYATPLGD